MLVCWLWMGDWVLSFAIVVFVRSFVVFLCSLSSFVRSFVVFLRSLSSFVRCLPSFVVFLRCLPSFIVFLPFVRCLPSFVVFLRSFARCLPSFLRSFLRSAFVRSEIRSFVRSDVHSPSLSPFAHSFHSSCVSFTPKFVRAFGSSFVCWLLVPTIVHSFRSLCRGPVCPSIGRCQARSPWCVWFVRTLFVLELQRSCVLWCCGAVVHCGAVMSWCVSCRAAWWRVESCRVESCSCPSCTLLSSSTSSLALWCIGSCRTHGCGGCIRWSERAMLLDSLVVVESQQQALAWDCSSFANAVDVFLFVFISAFLKLCGCSPRIAALTSVEPRQGSFSRQASHGSHPRTGVCRP